MTKCLAILTVPPLASKEEIKDISTIWGKNVELVFTSILNERTKEAIQPFLPDEGDRVLMVVLEDGTKTTISINKLVPIIEQRLLEIKDKVEGVFLSCGGDFPKLNSPLLFVQPNIVLRNMISGVLLPGMRIGIITPDERQVSHVRDSWINHLEIQGINGVQVLVDYAPPQDRAQIEQCAKRLAEKKVDLVVVECLGYREELREIIAKEVYHKPVILIRTIMAHFVRELI